MNLFGQRRFEEPQHKKLFSWIRSVVVKRQDDGLHEFGRPILRHFEDQSGQIGRTRLQQIEEMLIRLQTRAGISRQLLQAVGKCRCGSGTGSGGVFGGVNLSLRLMLLQILVVIDDVLQSDSIAD